MGHEVQQTRWDQLIRRAGGSIGPGSRVAESLSELFPVLDVETLPAELLFLNGTRLAFGSVNLGASAAEFSKIQLFNPPGSGMLVTLTSAYFNTSGAAVSIEASFSSAALATPVGNAPLRDTRTGVAVLPVATINQEQDASGIPSFIQFRLNSIDTLKITDPNGIVVLAPGTGITWAPQIVNNALMATFFWRERVTVASELNF